MSPNNLIYINTSILLKFLSTSQNLVRFYTGLFWFDLTLSVTGAELFQKIV